MVGIGNSKRGFEVASQVIDIVVKMLCYYIKDNFPEDF